MRLGIRKLLLYKLENILKSQGILNININACFACLNEEDEHISTTVWFFIKGADVSMLESFINADISLTDSMIWSGWKNIWVLI